MLDLSVIVLSYNCKHKLKRCLESVRGFAAEIVVVDSLSDDGTYELACSYTQKAISQKWLGYAQQKNVALKHVSKTWVLWLDSDEYLEDSAKSRIEQCLQGDEQLAYFLPRRTWFMGRAMNHCFGGDWVLRLFPMSSEVHFPPSELHESLEVPCPKRRLSGAVIEHFPYENLSAYLEKFRSYAHIQAKVYHQAGKTVGFARLCVAFPFTFLKMYVFKRGFLDGLPGLILCVMSAAHNFWKYALLWEKNCGFVDHCDQSQHQEPA